MAVRDSSSSSSLARTVLTTMGFLLIAAFFLQTEHRAHLFGALPFLFLLACPLLHMFMHRGHGSHGDGGAPPGDPRRSGSNHSSHGPSAEDFR